MEFVCLSVTAQDARVLKFCTVHAESRTCCVFLRLSTETTLKFGAFGMLSHALQSTAQDTG